MRAPWEGVWCADPCLFPAITEELGIRPMVEEPGFSPEEDLVSVALEVAGSSVALEVIGIDRVPVVEESGCTLEEG